MLEQTQTVLQTKCLLTTGSTVVAGVSGGPDSVCLMDLLYRLGYPIVVAHFNHRMRAESEEEAREVEDLSRRLGVPILLGEGDVLQYAETRSLSLEERARILRYRFLFDVAEQVEAQAVAVGHTANDQVETVLMHLLRGAGLSGLQGMAYRTLPNPWSETIPLVRPLLGAWRADVLAYINERDLHPVLDPTNQDRTFFRNRLRNELIPSLESYNPKVRERVWKMAQILQEDHAIIAGVVQAAWEASILEMEEDYILIDLPTFKTQPLGIQRHLLRRAISLLLPGLRDIDFESIERGLALMTDTGPNRQCDLGAGLQMFLEGERLWIAGGTAALPAEEWPQLPTGARLLLAVPGYLALPGGWVLKAERTDLAAAQEAAAVNRNPYRAWVSSDEIQAPLEVRSRLPGERFKPFGLQGHSKKLSDFMIDARLPQRVRSGWPLVVSRDEVVWVPGYRLAHTFRLTSGSTQAIHLRLERLPSDQSM
jgi:tRNA(Ile)-lysidine synthase